MRLKENWLDGMVGWDGRTGMEMGMGSSTWDRGRVGEIIGGCWGIGVAVAVYCGM